MNIQTNFLQEHLSLKAEGGMKEFAVLILKPDCLKEEDGELISFVDAHHLEIIDKREKVLSMAEVVALYPESFSYSNNDLTFGIEWKLDTLAYLTSGPSMCYLIKGDNAIAQLMQYKYALREKYGKITRPTSPMTSQEFNDKVVRNLVHVADSDETQSALWILFS